MSTKEHQESPQGDDTTAEHMRFYEALETTDPNFTKRQTTGAKLTSISPQYQVRKMTERFGPVGIGWGFDLTYSEIIDGVLMIDKNLLGENGQPKEYGHSKIHTARIRLWYFDPDAPKLDSKGDRARPAEVQGTGHTKFIYLTSYGPMMDDEYEKKSITDALTKAMSMIGMGGDVRMGLFDDSDYVAELSREAALEGAEDKETALVEAEQEFREWYATTLKLIETATNMNELEKVYRSAIKRIDIEKRFSKPEQRKAFTDAKNERGRNLIKSERKDEGDAE